MFCEGNYILYDLVEYLQKVIKEATGWLVGERY